MSVLDVDFGQSQRQREVGLLQRRLQQDLQPFFQRPHATQFLGKPQQLCHGSLGLHQLLQELSGRRLFAGHRHQHGEGHVLRTGLHQPHQGLHGQSLVRLGGGVFVPNVGGLVHGVHQPTSLLAATLHGQLRHQGEGVGRGHRRAVVGSGV